MARKRERLSTPAQIYVYVIVAVGAGVLTLSILDLATRPAGSWSSWLPLAALTLISGSLSVKLPSERATISISETFVLAGTVILGKGVGALLVAIDALVLCLKELLFGRGLRWEQVIFNIVTPATSLWFAALAVGLNRPAPGAALTVTSVSYTHLTLPTILRV